MINNNVDFETKITAWSESVKRLILIQSQVDNYYITKKYYLNNNISKICYFNDHKLAKIEDFSEDGKNKFKIYYSHNGLLKLVDEFYDNGSFANEKIYFGNKEYGVYSNYDFQNTLVEHGYYFKGKRIGQWKFREKDGKISQIDYKNYQLVDSLPSISDNFPSNSF